MRARTGLWEPWVSNHPGRPGPPARRNLAQAQRSIILADTSAT